MAWGLARRRRHDSGLVQYVLGIARACTAGNDATSGRQPRGVSKLKQRAILTAVVGAAALAAFAYAVATGMLPITPEEVSNATATSSSASR